MLRRLMIALICFIGGASSSAFAQQKLDQAAVERWREDLRDFAEKLPARHTLDPIWLYSRWETLTKEPFAGFIA